MSTARSVEGELLAAILDYKDLHFGAKRTTEEALEEIPLDSTHYCFVPPNPRTFENSDSSEEPEDLIFLKFTKEELDDMVSSHNDYLTAGVILLVIFCIILALFIAAAAGSERNKGFQKLKLFFFLDSDCHHTHHF